MSVIGNVGGILLQSNGLGRYIPEPRNTASSTFGKVLSAVGGALEKGGSVAGIGGDYLGLLQAQIRVQQEMMLVSMYSNIEKSKHETSMAAVRNLRVG